VDGRPNRRNKAAFSYFSIVVHMGPKQATGDVTKARKEGHDHLREDCLSI